MKRPTEAQAARIERRIELLRADGHHTQANALESKYWDACDLSPDVRRQLNMRRFKQIFPTKQSMPWWKDKV